MKQHSLTFALHDNILAAACKLRPYLIQMIGGGTGLTSGQFVGRAQHAAPFRLMKFRAGCRQTLKVSGCQKAKPTKGAGIAQQFPLLGRGEGLGGGVAATLF